METNEKSICPICSTKGNIFAVVNCGAQIICSNEECPYEAGLWTVTQDCNQLNVLKDVFSIENGLVNGRHGAAEAEIPGIKTISLCSPQRANGRVHSSPKKGGTHSPTKSAQQVAASSAEANKDTPAYLSIIAQNFDFDDGICAQYKKFVIWPNRDSLCWLNAAMSLLVHSYTVRKFVVSTQSACQVMRIFGDYQRILTDLNNHTMNALGSLRFKRQLQIMQEYVFTFLEKDIKCVKGRPDSPVFALALLLRQDSTLMELFQIKHSWTLCCQNCKFENAIETTATRPVVSFHKALPDFTMTAPVSVGMCAKCHKPDQEKRLNFEKLPPSFIYYFENGIPTTDVTSYDFEFKGVKYFVKGIILYTTASSQKHFVPWIRDVKRNMWLNCDDLRNGSRSFSTTGPRIVPSEVHIIMWENICVSSEQSKKNSSISEVKIVGSKIDDKLKLNTKGTSGASTSKTTRMRHRSGPSALIKPGLLEHSKQSKGNSTKKSDLEKAVNSLQLDTDTEDGNLVIVEDKKSEDSSETGDSKSEGENSHLYPDVQLPAFESSVCSFTSLQSSIPSVVKQKLFGNTEVKIGDQSTPTCGDPKVLLQNIFTGRSNPLTGNIQISPSSPPHAVEQNQLEIASPERVEPAKEKSPEKGSSILSKEFVEPDGTRIERFIAPEQDGTGDVNEQASLVLPELNNSAPSESLSEMVKEQLESQKQPEGSAVPKSNTKTSKEVSSAKNVAENSSPTTGALSSPVDKDVNSVVTPVTPQRRSSRRNLGMRGANSRTAAGNAVEEGEVPKDTGASTSGVATSGKKGCAAEEQMIDQLTVGAKLTSKGEKMVATKKVATSNEIANPDPSVLQLNGEFKIYSEPVAKPHVKNAGIKVRKRHEQADPISANSGIDGKKGKTEEEFGCSLVVPPDEPKELSSGAISATSVESTEKSSVSVTVSETSKLNEVSSITDMAQQPAVGGNAQKNCVGEQVQKISVDSAVNKESQPGQSKVTSKGVPAKEKGPEPGPSKISRKGAGAKGKEPQPGASKITGKSAVAKVIESQPGPSKITGKGAVAKEKEPQPGPSKTAGKSAVAKEKEPQPGPSTSRKKQLSSKNNQEKPSAKAQETRTSAKYNLRGKPKVTSVDKVSQQADENSDDDDDGVRNDWLLWTSEDESENEYLPSAAQKESVFLKNRSKRGKAASLSPSKSKPAVNVESVGKSESVDKPERGRPGRKRKQAAAKSSETVVKEKKIKRKSAAKPGEPVVEEKQIKGTSISELGSKSYGKRKAVSSKPQDGTENVDVKKTGVVDSDTSSSAKEKGSEGISASNTLLPQLSGNNITISPSIAQAAVTMTSSNTVTIPQFLTCLSPPAVKTSSPNTLPQPGPLLLLQTLPTSGPALKVNAVSSGSTTTPTSAVQLITTTTPGIAKSGDSKQIKNVFFLPQNFPKSAPNTPLVRFAPNATNPFVLPGNMTLEKIMITSTRPGVQPTAGTTLIRPAAPVTPLQATNNDLAGEKILLLTEKIVPGVKNVLSPVKPPSDNKPAAQTTTSPVTLKISSPVSLAVPSSPSKLVGSPEKETVTNIEKFINKLETAKEKSSEEASATSKDAPLSQKDAPPLQKDAPLTQKDAPLTQKDAPLTQKDAPLPQKDAPGPQKQRGRPRKGIIVVGDDEECSPPKQPKKPVIENQPSQEQVIVRRGCRTPKRRTAKNSVQAGHENGEGRGASNAVRGNRRAVRGSPEAKSSRLNVSLSDFGFKPSKLISNILDSDDI